MDTATGSPVGVVVDSTANAEQYGSPQEQAREPSTPSEQLATEEATSETRTDCGSPEVLAMELDS